MNGIGAFLRFLHWNDKMWRHRLDSNKAGKYETARLKYRYEHCLCLTESQLWIIECSVHTSHQGTHSWGIGNTIVRIVVSCGHHCVVRFDTKWKCTRHLWWDFYGAHWDRVYLMKLRLVRLSFRENSNHIVLTNNYLHWWYFFPSCFSSNQCALGK